MRVLVAIVGLVLVGVPALMWISAQATLDRSLAHTRGSQNLPVFGEERAAEVVQIPLGELSFRARIAGFEHEGPGLILLHGFPETSIMWEPLIARAAEAGFRVVAFDQRGYSPGARPDRIEDYEISNLIQDLMGIADAVGFERFHLVGHDWGSIVGWAAAAGAPDRVLSWASLSIPHPGAIRDPAVPPSMPGYVRVFRVPGLAETLLGFGGRWMLQSQLYASMPASHRAEYDAVFGEPGALRAALNWYRAAPSDGPAQLLGEPLEQPVFYIYGKRDMPVFVAPEVQARMPGFVRGPFESVALDAGHWLIQEEETPVVDGVLAHLERARSGGSTPSE